MPRSLLDPRAERLTVLYDGDCGLCNLSVLVLNDLDLEHRLEFVPLRHASRHAERPELTEIALRYPVQESIHVLRADGGVHAGGAAVLEILDVLPTGWLFRPWHVLPGFEPLLDRAYHLLADRRGMISRLLERWARPLAVCHLDGAHAIDDKAKHDGEDGSR